MIGIMFFASVYIGIGISLVLAWQLITINFFPKRRLDFDYEEDRSTAVFCVVAWPLAIVVEGVTIFCRSMAIMFKKASDAMEKGKRLRRK